MNLRRQVRLVYVPVTDGVLDLPDQARIVQVDFADERGLLLGHEPVGVWIEQVVARTAPEPPFDPPEPGTRR